MMIVRFDLGTYLKPKHNNAIWVGGQDKPNHFRKTDKGFEIFHHEDKVYYPISVEVIGHTVVRHRHLETVEVEATISFHSGKQKFKADMQINQDGKKKYKREIDKFFEETFGSINNELL